MAYFGKEFTFEKEENYEELIAALAKEDETAKKFFTFRPNQKLEKDGDDYKLVFITPDGPKGISFKADETVEETISEGLTCKNTFTLDGDTLVQVQDYGDRGTITYTREYSENELKVTVTSSNWDGAAYRWYTAA